MVRRLRKVPLRRVLWVSTLGVLIAAIAGVGVYAFYLDRSVTQQFQGRRWTLPAQVFP